MSDSEPDNRLFQQFDTKKLEDLTADNLDSFRDQVYIQKSNSDLVNDLIRYGVMNNQISLSGPISRSMKLFTYRYTGTGNNYEDLSIAPGEVWAFNTLSIAEGGSGTATVSFAIYDPVSTDQSFFAVHSTGSQDPVPVSADSMGSPIYMTSDFRLNNLVNATGGTHVDVDLTIIRVR
jgi:hypothetical protein